MASQDRSFADLLAEAPAAPAEGTVSLVGALAKSREAGKFVLTLQDGRTVMLETSAVKGHTVLGSSVGRAIVRIEIEASKAPAFAPRRFDRSTISPLLRNSGVSDQIGYGDGDDTPPFTSEKDPGESDPFTSEKDPYEKDPFESDPLLEKDPVGEAQAPMSTPIPSPWPRRIRRRLTSFEQCKRVRAMGGDSAAAGAGRAAPCIASPFSIMQRSFRTPTVQVTGET